MTPGEQHHGCAFFKGVEDKTLISSPTAHGADEAVIRRKLHPGCPCQVPGGIAAPVAQESNNLLLRVCIQDSIYLSKHLGIAEVLHGYGIEAALSGTGATTGAGGSYQMCPGLSLDIYLNRPVGADTGTDTARVALVKVNYRFDSLTFDDTSIQEDGTPGGGGSSLGDAVLYVFRRFDAAGEEYARRRCIYRLELGMRFHQKAIVGLREVKDTDEPLQVSLWLKPYREYHHIQFIFLHTCRCGILHLDQEIPGRRVFPDFAGDASNITHANLSGAAN